MQSSQIPAKFNIPFAKNAGGSYIRPIPQASQIGITPGAASLNDGFPPQTFTPLASGGVPPSGADFNGILNAITQWVQWMNAGAPVYYDAAFATAIGGYPSGALVTANAGAMWYLSTTENNATNPNTGGAGWMQVVPSSPSSVPPLINGTATIGTSLLFARADHVHPTDTTRAALTYVNSTFLTIATAAATYLTINNPSSSGTRNHVGADVIQGDITAYRAASPTTGVIYLGNSGARYLYFDGTNYVMPGAELYVNGTAVASGIATAQTTANNAVAGLVSKAAKITGAWNSFTIPDIPVIVKSGSAGLTSAAGAAMFTGSVTFPTAFPTSCYNVIPVLSSLESSSLDYYATLTCSLITRTGFFWKLRKLTVDGSWSCNYLAFGV